jgi:uncharacterized protein (TIGR00290 family)
METPIIMCWSGGKDSAYALWRLQQDSRFRVEGLLTTVTEGYDRVSMHGVRNALLEAQSSALGLPLIKVSIPPACPNSMYERRMAEAIDGLKARGIHAVAFGDLFLEDIRAYRERQCAGAGIQPHFPIWGEDTAELARRMIGEGFRATLCCVDPRKLGAEYAGRAYDSDLLDGLPSGVDPCGENGEFHTFVHGAPNLSAPISIRPGEVVEREGFVFADLLPGEPAP